jgi:hypothetical protein
MASGMPWKRSLERIRLSCDSSPDHRSLRGAVLAEVGRVVLFNAFAWPLADPVIATGISPMALSPCHEELPLLIRLKYLTPVGRWTQLAAGPSPVTTLLRETAGDPSRSLVWNGLMKRYGVSDVLFAVLADKHGCWGWLDLWRMAQDDSFTVEPFTAEEVEYLAAVVHEVTPALRQSIARQFVMEIPGGLEAGGSTPAGSDAVLMQNPTIARRPKPDLPQQAVLSLDAEMLVAGATASGDEWLRRLQAGPRPFQGVPAEVLNVAAQLLALERTWITILRRPGRGRWAMLRASRMDSAGSVAIPPLAVTIQACPPEARLDMFARSFGLTPGRGN